MKAAGIALRLMAAFMAAPLREALQGLAYTLPSVTAQAHGPRSRRAKSTTAQDQRRARKAQAVAREKARQRGRR